MKKRNSWVVMLAAGLLFVGTQTVQAGSSAVGDGGYVGVNGGFGTAIVSSSGSMNHTNVGAAVAGWDIADGGIGMDGASYGAFMGYGFRMGSFYAGAEVDGHWSDMKFDPGTISVQEGGGGGSGSITRTVTSASAELEFTGGVAGRLGYYVNPSTLFSLNGGLVGSQFDVSWGGTAEEYWDPGARYGVALESSLFDGIAVRLDWSITDYYNAEVFGIGSVVEKPGSVSVEIQPTMSVAHLGLVYTF